MGAGRSGSTVLGVTLGNCENVFFAGELDRWMARAGVPRRGGDQLEQFWGTIRDDVKYPPELRGGRTPSLERSSALFDVRKWRRRRRLRPYYLRTSARLYQALTRATGATHIVDSSHYPLRARQLQTLEEIDLYLIYLMRDPRSVVASLARKDVPERAFGLLAANAYLWLTQLLSVIVFLRHPRTRRVFVRHEDFLANPEEVLRQLLRACDSRAEVPDLTALRTGLPFHGNRLIEVDVVRLEQRPSATPPRSRLTLLAQSPWLALASRLRPAARP
jgi:hypothetical protein